MTPFGTWLAEIGLGRYDEAFTSNETERVNDFETADVSI